MRKFEFVLRRNFKEKGWRFLFVFFAFMIPSSWMRSFTALLLLSRLLPWDIESGEEEILLSLPLRRYEIFLYDFLIGFSTLFVSAVLTRHLFSFDFKDLLVIPYVYGISVLSAFYGKGNFILPLLIVTVDSAFCWTDWVYISPVCRGSWIGSLIDLVVFIVAFAIYSSDGKLREGFVW